MRQSKLFTKTAKQPPRDETSVNAKLLEQGGFITKLMAGVYCYLPLGYRVLRRIENVIREEMNTLGGQEVFLPALQPRELWEKTGRWAGLKDVMYQFRDHAQRDVGLAITHEEVVADLVRRFVSSYKDLPIAVYQIQTKFRHELRPKSGLTRGREFSMKDLYSGHPSQEDCDAFYERAKESYRKIFRRLGLDARIFQKTFRTNFKSLPMRGKMSSSPAPNVTMQKTRKSLTSETETTAPCAPTGQSRCIGRSKSVIFLSLAQNTAAVSALFSLMRRAQDDQSSWPHTASDRAA